MEPTATAEPYDQSPADFARIVGVHPITVQRWLSKGALKGIGIELPTGGRRFRRSEVEAYIESMRAKAGAEVAS